MSDLEQTILARETCCNCFMDFAMPRAMQEARRRDKKSFYCPNGHPMSYTGENQEAILRRERDRLAQQIAQRDDEIARRQRGWEEAEKRAAVAERKIKRVEKRAHAGLCPCCNRSFSELAKHIATKHPSFRAEDVTRENVVSLVKGRAS